MNKCVDCAYFLNCEKANEEEACEKYRYIRKNIEIKEEIANMIKEKRMEKEIADLFYKMCPKVPSQTLAIAVRQTIENFKELDSLYNPNIKKDYKYNAIDSLKYIEGMLSKETVIKLDGKKLGELNIPSVIKEQKMYDDNYKNTPKID